MYRFGRSLVAGFLWLLGGVASAADYSAQVLAADQEGEARLAALRTAVQQVATRLAGAPDAATPTRLGGVWRDPARYVQEYRYSLPPGAEPGNPQRLLEVRFDGAALERALQSTGVSPWRSRPVILLWLAELQAGRQVLLGEQDARVQALLAQARADLGLEILLPLGDLEDQRSLPLSDLWGGFTETIRPASARYGAQVIVVGRLAPQLEGGWQGRWLLLGERERVIAWDTTAPDAGQALSAGLNESWGRLWRNFGPDAPGAAEQSQTVQIAGIRQATDYAQLLALLRELPEVRTVQMQQLAEGVLTLQLRYRSAPEDFRQRLLQAGRLSPEALDAQAAVWRYQWR